MATVIAKKALIPSTYMKLPALAMGAPPPVMAASATAAPSDPTAAATAIPPAS